MRQESSQSNPQSNSGYSTESNQARKQRMDKKRAIRKNKVGIVQEQAAEQKTDKRFLSKEQKMQLQKTKNRQAAQRSRDQHKKYVQDLQEQNKLLKDQLSKPRYCTQCSKLVVSQVQDFSQHHLLELQNERPIDTFVQNQNNQELQDYDSHFIRMNDYEQSSPLKMFLFVSMIMLGIFLVGTGSGTSTIQNVPLQRDLMQIKNQKNDQIFQNFKTKSSENIDKRIIEIQKFDIMNSISNNFNMVNQGQEDKLITHLAPSSYQLSALSRQNCIRSIIDKNYTIQTISHPLPPQQVQIIKKATSLRANNLYQMQIFSNKNKQTNDNILFCSMPKIYRRNQDNPPHTNFLTKFIDIIISGSQMMQIIGKSPNLWMNKMINFNGIYKINAEIKQIVQIEDKNCIL